MKHLNRLDKRQLIMMVNITIKEMIITLINKLFNSIAGYTNWED